MDVQRTDRMHHLECRILGTFYKDTAGKMLFGADTENFYSAHHYSVVKPNSQILEYIVNFREGDVTGRPSDLKLGTVRYSSSRRFQEQEALIPVYVRPQDFLGKRTALFGMTRTGKSNTVKKIIEASLQMSQQAPYTLDQPMNGNVEANLEPFTKTGVPKYPAGQIIFDINGEYANPNLQDEGTAIFEIYQESVSRYSVLQKSGFKVMKVNFYRDIESGFELICSHLDQSSSYNYIDSFKAVDMTKPSDYDTNFSARTRYDRRLAAYLCCLNRAGLPAPLNFAVKFQGEATLNGLVRANGGIDPSKGITFDDAVDWFEWVWDNYTHQFFTDYRVTHGHEWADEDLKALLVFLTRKRNPGNNANVDGYRKLRGVIDLHTNTVGQSFETEIVEELRAGLIVIIDLSQGDPGIQSLYSERICRQIFARSLGRFIENTPNNFIQFYFEEAHNLFPKKDDQDLSQIYNRLAKEGAKLNLGLIYATQEVSSISANILKNTQNWFVSHLNNDDETREIKKYYDFGDFADSLVRFSANTDRGFARMKTYSTPFVVPVQIDRFSANSKTTANVGNQSEG